MKYDIEMVIPVCLKLKKRTEDFKKYGIINTSGKKVLVTLIASNDEEIEGLGEGWPEGVDVRVRKNKCPDHVSNLYRFYVDLTHEDLNSRWIMRLDDDSCNEVGGLIDDLDSMYDWEDKFYLGDLNNFECALHAGESHVFPEYKHLLGDLASLAPSLKNETECGIVSHGAMKHVLSNKKSMALLRQRAELRGGFGDCVFALAAALAKLYPIQCPVISHLPRINDFSLFGGHLKHIHMVSRNREGENFGSNSRCAAAQYDAIVKSIDGGFTEKEKIFLEKRYLMENEREISVWEFKPNRTVKMKFDERNYVWNEFDGKIRVFDDAVDIRMSLAVDDSGCVVGENQDGDKFVFKAIT